MHGSEGVLVAPSPGPPVLISTPEAGMSFRIWRTHQATPSVCLESAARHLSYLPKLCVPRLPFLLLVPPEPRVQKTRTRRPQADLRISSPSHIMLDQMLPGGCCFPYRIVLGEAYRFSRAWPVPACDSPQIILPLRLPSSHQEPRSSCLFFCAPLFGFVFKRPPFLLSLLGKAGVQNIPRIF